MLMPTIAILLYCSSALLLWRGVSSGTLQPRGWVPLAALAVLFHAEVHAEAWRLLQGPDMHFFAALSLVGLGMAALTTGYGANGRMPALGLVVLPLAMLSLLAYSLYGHTGTATHLDWRLQLHAWLALLAYATLALSAVLAVFLWAQERALRQHRLGTWLRALPPLTELETLLFRSIAVGFTLLTTTLLTGVLFVENLLAQHLVHKTVLSALSWLAFGALLLGRRQYGWRGSIAVRWTLTAMGLLVLAFFGSKFVLELLLHRSV
jgi:ABC-type uncharacterized transport system permease subunit